MRVRLRELENVPLQKLKIACIMMRLFILQVPKQIKNYILRKLPQQKRAQLLCNHSREHLYLLAGLKWVWKSFFFPGGEHLIIIITILQTRETEAQKDEATSPRSPKRPAAEPESETESLNIQSWFLDHSVP